MVLLGGLMVLSVGCSTTDQSLVNMAAINQRTSRTNEQSLDAIKSTAALRMQRNQDYRVGPEDLLEISIFEWELSEETKTSVFRVAESGVISMPVIGELNVGEQTVEEIRAAIETRLQTGGFIKQPRVAVNIREYRSKKVAVVGAVQEPGTYTLRQNVTTLLDILSLAGGANREAGQVAHIIRQREGYEDTDEDENDEVEGNDAETGEGVPPALAQSGLAAGGDVTTVDLYELLDKGNIQLNMVLKNSDVVYVPAADSYSVSGYVRKPGTFKLQQPITILDAVAKAGGIIEGEASPRHCILRRYKDEREILRPIDLLAVAKGAEPNLYLSPGDVLVVRQTGAKKAWLNTFGAFKAIFNVGYSL